MAYPLLVPHKLIYWLLLGGAIFGIFATAVFIVFGISGAYPIQTMMYAAGSSFLVCLVCVGFWMHHVFKITKERLTRQQIKYNFGHLLLAAVSPFDDKRIS